MKFEKGNKYSRGGKMGNKGGRPTKAHTEAKKLAAEIVRDYIEKNIKPVLKAYGQFAAGRLVKHRNKDTGAILWTEFEADPRVTCHFIDKLLPTAKQELDLLVHGKVEVFTNVQPDLGPKKVGGRNDGKVREG